MRYFLTVLISKAASFALKLLGRKATTTPGRIALKLYPDILGRMAKSVSGEIVAVMGTNGKTTTNNLLADCFEADGKQIVANRVGANLLSGVTAAFLDKANIFGKIHADAACLEMDEAWAKHILKYVTPTKIIVNNLFRDQLDRYGEIDITMRYLKDAISLAPNAELICNADDPLVAATVRNFKNKTLFFGIKEPFRDYESKIKEGKFCYCCGKPLQYRFYHYSQLGDYACECGFKRPEITFNAQNIQVFPHVAFELEGFGTLKTKRRGMYNIYNILAAAACAAECGVPFDKIAASVLNYRPQIGRMEEFSIGGKSVYLILAKNPAGFNQSVSSVLEDPRTKDVVIAINDGAQDGRDVSWLWDVDFDSMVQNSSVLSYKTTGARYADMGLRLKYAGIEEKKIQLFAEVKEAVNQALSGKGETLYVLVNYTALFSTQALLKELEAKSGGVEK